MRINWFAPLSLVQDTSNLLSLSLLQKLGQENQIIWWVNQSGNRSSEYLLNLDQNTQIKFYELDNIAWPEVHQGDINIYNIGNDPERYQDIWMVAQQCPGIIILQDLNYQAFFTRIYQENDNKKGYLEQMQYYYGVDTIKIAEQFWQGEIPLLLMAENYPLIPLVVKNALGVVSHHQPTYLDLKEKNQWLTCYIPSPYRDLNIYADSLLDFAHYVCRFRCQGTMAYFIERIAWEMGMWSQNLSFCLEQQKLTQAILFLSSPNNFK